MNRVIADFLNMEAFAPDFSHYWLADQSRDAKAEYRAGIDDEPLSASLKEALEALAERITAARSIV